MINVVVTCTKKKRKGPQFPLSEGLQLGSIKGNLDRRFQQWVDNISSAEVPRVTAKNLYIGDHWSVACSIPQTIPDIKLWVCSAGYGLITPESKIKPYSATFSTHNFDSVGSTIEENQKWWAMLNEYRGEMFCDPEQPRSITEIASQDPGSHILVIASKNYLNAIQHDVSEATSTLYDRFNLAIISAGTRNPGAFSDNLIQCDARFGQIVKGALRSLNIRIGREILSQGIVPDTLAIGSDLVNAMKCGIDQIAPNGLPELRRYSDRQSQTDQQIKAFISDQLVINSAYTATKLLRELRQTHKKQCEQRRFSNLFSAVKNEGLQSGIS